VSPCASFPSHPIATEAVGGDCGIELETTLLWVEPRKAAVSMGWSSAAAKVMDNHTDERE